MKVLNFNEKKKKHELARIDNGCNTHVKIAPETPTHVRVGPMEIRRQQMSR